MELNKHRFALEGALAMGALYSVCGIFTALWPDTAVKLLGWMTHIVDVKNALDVKATLSGFVIGLLFVLVYSYFAALIFTWIHNRNVIRKA